MRALANAVLLGVFLSIASCEGEGTPKKYCSPKERMSDLCEYAYTIYESAPELWNKLELVLEASQDQPVSLQLASEAYAEAESEYLLRNEEVLTRAPQEHLTEVALYASEIFDFNELRDRTTCGIHSVQRSQLQIIFAPPYAVPGLKLAPANAIIRGIAAGASNPVLYQKLGHQELQVITQALISRGYTATQVELIFANKGSPELMCSAYSSMWDAINQMPTDVRPKFVAWMLTL